MCRLLFVPHWDHLSRSIESILTSVRHMNERQTETPPKHGFSQWSFPTIILFHCGIAVQRKLQTPIEYFGSNTFSTFLGTGYIFMFCVSPTDCEISSSPSENYFRIL